MLIIADHRLPVSAKEKLSEMGDFFSFCGNYAYEAIRSHPDVYICQMPGNRLVLSPNAPVELFSFLKNNNVPFVLGSKNVGTKFPDTALYNAVFFNNTLIANKKYCDKSIVDAFSSCRFVDVSQAYVRCNLIFLAKNMAICSDESICKALKNIAVDVLYVNPHGIVLPPFEYGFIGGCLGVYDNRLIVSGSLSFHSQGYQIRAFADKAGLKIIELFNGPLLDVGGIFFL